ncbi:MAG: oligosaccharide flippase family protein [Allosphingosinicella sp.]|uniref:oligosaccharide flippase family protein n=1 Tax=Allosphingosinicella sp. TaxID=2823234 RepID=UPI00392FA4E2
MSISRHTTYNMLGALAPLVVTLLTVPLYLEVVGVERYGALTLCWIVIGYFGFLDLGLGPAVAQRTAASLRGGEAGEQGAIFTTATLLSVAMGITAGILFYAASLLYPEFASERSELTGEFLEATPLLALLVPLVMMNSVATGMLQGQERFLTLNVIVAISSTLMSALPLLFAWLTVPNLFTLVAGALAARVVGCLLAFAAARGSLGRGGLGGFRAGLVVPLLKFGGWVTVTTAAAPLLLTIDRLALGALLGAAAVAAYAIAYSLVSRLSMVPTSLATALFPRFAGSQAEERDRLVSVSVPAIAVIMTPAVVAGLVATRPFFELWIGQELAAICAPVAYILFLGVWVNSFGQIPFALLQGSGRPDIVSKLHLAELAPYWAVLFAGIWAFGLPGAAAAWALRMAADTLLLYLLAGTGMARLRQLVPPALLVVASFLAAALAPAGWREALGAGLLVAAMIWAWHAMPPFLKQQLAALAARVRGRGAPASEASR